MYHNRNISLYCYKTCQTQMNKKIILMFVPLFFKHIPEIGMCLMVQANTLPLSEEYITLQKMFLHLLIHMSGETLGGHQKNYF